MTRPYLDRRSASGSTGSTYRCRPELIEEVAFLCDFTQSRTTGTARVKSISTLWILALAASIGVTPAAARQKAKRDPWLLCPAADLPAGRPSAEGLDPGFVSLTSDEAQMVEDGPSIFTGNVELVRDDNALRTDRLTWDEPREIAEALGHTRLWSGDLYWEGERATVNLDTEQGRLETGLYRILSGRGHGRAANAETDLAHETSDFKDVDYTTCPGETPDWQLSAESLHLDHEAEWGSARNVVFRVRGVPVAYTPYMSFPLSDKRKSGFLPPSFGSSRDAGFDVSLPYYWNIAPNMDATVAPRVIGRRGVMLMGQYRYLFTQGHGQLDLGYMPQDSLEDDDYRGIVTYEHQQGFAGGRGTADVFFNSVSDKEYFEDFSNNLSISSTRFLERQGRITYGGNGWSVNGRVLNYQTVDPTLPSDSRPYTMLPQVYYYATLPLGVPRLSAGLYGETTYFERDGTTEGGRIDVKPVLAYSLYSTPGAYVTPRLSLSHTQYLLEDNPGGNHIDRTVPTVNLDSGLFFERELAVGGEGYIHTLEPRLFYLYRPEVDQDDIPVFDTGEYSFSDKVLFYENRFSGIDRLADANSLSVSLSSALIQSATGDELVRATLGQIYHFSDLDVQLPGVADDTDPYSALIADVLTRLSSSWTARGTLQWDPNNDQTDKLAMRLRYRPTDGRKILNLDYRFRNASTDVDQTDVSFRWPVGRNWGVVGRWNYSLPEQETLEVVGGLEYESCCWGLKVVGRRFLRTADGQFDTGVFMQVELKGLANLGTGASNLLRKNVPGYENDL